MKIAQRNPGISKNEKSLYFSSRVRDMNQDGKDDFLMLGNEDKYPCYYGNSIIWGNFPVDTVTAVSNDKSNLPANSRNIIYKQIEDIQCTQ